MLHNSRLSLLFSLACSVQGRTDSRCATLHAFTRARPQTPRRSPASMHLGTPHGSVSLIKVGSLLLLSTA